MKLSRKKMMVMAAIVVVIILIVTVVIPMMNNSSDSAAAPAAPSDSNDKSTDDSETPAAPAVPVVDLSGSFERLPAPNSLMKSFFDKMPSTIILDKDGKLKSYESKNSRIMAVQKDDGSITVNSDPNAGVRYHTDLKRVNNNTLSGKVAGYRLNYVM